MTESLDFDDVARTFVAYYNDFWEKIQRAGSHIDPAKHCYLLFGLPGVGKSTFIARLLSDIAPPEYFNGTVVNKKERSTVVEGVKVGHSFGASTLVPQIFHVGDMQMCDLPGFKDSDPKTQMIVKILQRCFMRLAVEKNVKFRYLVVLDTAFLQDGKLSKLNGDYLKELKSLFEVDFGNFLSSVFFILTKNDVVGLTHEQIQERTEELVMASKTSDDTTLPRFLFRLSENHVVVDYKQDDATALMGVIRTMVAKDDRNANLDLRQNLSDVRVEQQAELLNDICAKEIKRLVDKHNGVRLDFEEKGVPDLDTKMANLKIRVTTELKQSAVLAMKMGEASKELRAVEQDLAAYDQTSAALDAKAEADDVRVAACANFQALVERHAALREAVSLHTFCPHKVGVLFQEFLVDFTLELSHNTRYVVVVTRFEDRDAVLTKYIGSTSPIPPTLDVLNQAKGDGVVFNSACERVGNASSVEVRASDGRLAVKWKSDKEYCVCVYTSVPYVDSIEYLHLHNRLASNLRAAEIDLQASQQACQSFAEAHDNQQARLKALKTAVASCRKSIEQSSERLGLLKEDIKWQLDAACSFLDTAVNAKKGASSSIDLLMKVSEILNLHKFDVTFLRSLHALKEKHSLFTEPMLKKTSLEALAGEWFERIEGIIQTFSDVEKPPASSKKFSVLNGALSFGKQQ